MNLVELDNEGWRYLGKYDDSFQTEMVEIWRKDQEILLRWDGGKSQAIYGVEYTRQQAGTYAGSDWSRIIAVAFDTKWEELRARVRAYQKRVAE